MQNSTTSFNRISTLDENMTKGQHLISALACLAHFNVAVDLNHDVEEILSHMHSNTGCEVKHIKDLQHAAMHMSHFGY